ncbi:MAG TPA: hypothetical protein VGG34_00660 [Opitutaceae bacterium]|jgi:hypothetical protein
MPTLHTPEKPPLVGRIARPLACLAAAAVFLHAILAFRVPDKAMTALVAFGALNHERYLPELKAADHVEIPHSQGYDGQWYAEIAMHPRIDAALGRSVDALPYRGRRILFEWTAWLAGGGNPERALRAYAVQNIACWFLLGLLLLRWFPARSWGNVLRWAAVLFSFGLIFSVTRALLDGPGLLLIAAGMALLESGRPWAAAAVMGIGGLGKEIDVIGAAALQPGSGRGPRRWSTWAVQVVVAVLPLALWAACVRSWAGTYENLGARNFSVPFAGLGDKLASTVSGLVANGGGFPTIAELDALVLVGLLAQFSFFAFRIRWREAWWRVGAGFAALLPFLGDSVWQDTPSAAARVLLPMTLAFNVLVPGGARWLPLLVIGNLGILATPELLRAPNRVPESYVVEGPRALRLNPRTGHEVDVSFGAENWWKPEGDTTDFWRWSRGDGIVTVRNPQPFAVVADITFGLATPVERRASVSIGGRPAWRGVVKPSMDNPEEIRGVRLAPGDTVLLFRSDDPAAVAGPSDTRLITFSVRDLTVRLTGRPPL